MAKISRYKKGKKKALSAVVTTVILIALSVVAVTLVWAFAQNLIKKQIGSSESCFGNTDKVQINKQYTCYEKIGEGNYNLRFSLEIGDIEVDKVTVSVSSASSVKGYDITNTAQNISELRMYPSNSTNIILPGKNAGLTYKAYGLEAAPDSVKIAPTIGGNLCEVSDSFSEIEDCQLTS